METQQAKMGNFLLDKRVVNVINNIVDFSLKYNYDIPFSTKEKFNEIYEDLKMNKYLKNDTCYELMQHVDKNFVLTRSYVSMLKRFFTKDLVLQYTAMRGHRRKTNLRNNLEATSYRSAWMLSSWEVELKNLQLLSQKT
ncbi:uncharacterized protein LOC103318142 [Nasonia vitripennis]|uniref:Uncharacterized protein n=1 Tax=Nasonia vitripennis TaxID=7425 RepID=A0A7M7R123_NASVI|nr:uncharacterized protein LOC103318142 [Nasonia vitripennis]XP_016842201.1 uncharacterized protein LOC103318142 [Nasonia vitripennis]XP_032457542.1 uncharacterized protein LOC103318142 [Nasonia vitripennis]XP_032457543.1 uncharacterized protein LOC103318142 [Nasonia vitripennis]XP_032457544.1 uncharacterized protein LOC103318142 [Nasonia vitripennis]XP_032457545.1 uncharacterized protein LOC103318142 [Nasonia vitripennis]XP_032457546.1 uncharacterized protein LOC103318142 [Nasonia vitripenni